MTSVVLLCSKYTANKNTIVAESSITINDWSTLLKHIITYQIMQYGNKTEAV